MTDTDIGCWLSPCITEDNGMSVNSSQVFPSELVRSDMSIVHEQIDLSLQETVEKDAYEERDSWSRYSRS